jgi:FMN-dependent NADH-azoreductase
VARAGRTFQYTANGPEGLLKGKKVYVFVATGGVYSEGGYAPYDHVTTYLRAVLGFLGLTDITFIVTEGVALGEEAVAAALAKSRANIDSIVA